MHSMTGFGRAEGEAGQGKLNIEIRTVNHRFLDISMKMPRFMFFLEEDGRAFIKSKLARGRVEVFVNYTSTGEAEKDITVNMGVVRAYLSAADSIKKTLGVKNDIKMASLLRMNDVVSLSEKKADEEVLKKLFLDLLAQAIEMLVQSRRKEGVRITKDIFERIEILKDAVAKIKIREPQVHKEYSEKLRARIKDQLESSGIDENRFNAEVVYFMDRCSITEEIVRLKSHLQECVNMLNKPQANGRNMDFIVQELNREFNTIGSKSADVEITKMVLFAKGEVEKIREQIQNIE